MRSALLTWYDRHARDLPWRRTRDPYSIWVAEVMLQQTRVETVRPYYARFLERFPTVHALAEAPLDDVLGAWSGLGYYRRARLLHAGARHVRERHHGLVPREFEAIRAIPGVGAYTSGAIASQAFDMEAPIVDGNVARFVARLCALETDPKRGEGLGHAWRIATALVAGERPGALNNALIEIGATVCVPREPRCPLCPVADACVARAQGRQGELPVITKKAARPRVEETAAIVRVDGAPGVLLARCVAGGLFGGLWEPPRVAGHEPRAARASLSAMLGVAVRLEPKPARVVEHVLTHRHLIVAVHEVVVDRMPTALVGERYDACEAVDLADLEALTDAHRGMATLGRKLLGLGARGRRARTAPSPRR